MKYRYYLSMLSTFVLVMLFNAMYLMAPRSLEMFLVLAALHVVLFGVFNAIGTCVIYKPVERAFGLG
jgi:hypothetical protein